MELVYFLLLVQLACLLYQSVTCRNLKRSLRKAQDKAISVIKKNDVRLHELYLLFEEKFSSRHLPFPLKKVPLADEEGLVLSVRKIEVPTIPTAYNAALVEEGGEYVLFFRFDTPLCSQNRAAYASHIGCVQLTSDFTVRDRTISTIDTGSQFSEDARVFSHEKTHYLLFNDVVHREDTTRQLRLAPIDLKRRRLESIISLSLNSKQVEKNWTPFSHEGGLYFLHTISPQRILKLKNKSLDCISSSKSSRLPWSDTWGVLRGGTPAQLVDGKYLAFFHSSFEDEKGIRWYIMGACSFETSPPFRMLQISPYPILFKGIYETPNAHAAHLAVRSLYPVGFVYDRKQGKIHVSCGENDSAIKIVTMDKERLLAGLVDI